MKKIRKILSSWIIMICMILNYSTVIVRATDYSASRVVDYVNSMIGQSYANGYCLKFIEESYQKFYGFRAYSCCAYKSGSLYLDSTSRDIPLGASVFFGGSNVSCGSCGNRAGHIGIYVGNNNIVHAWGGKIVSTTIDYVVSCGYPYRGWGWMCNTALTTKPDINTVACITDGAYDITSTSARLVGTFSNPTSARIIRRGFQWGSTPDMCNYTEFDCNITWSDGLTHTMSNLLPNTTYYFKLIVVGENGTYIYGNVKSFTTLSPTIAIQNLAVLNINNTSFTIHCTTNTTIARAYIIVYGPGGNSGNGFDIYNINNTSFSKTININEYGGVGEYIAHVYVWDYSNNSVGTSTERFHAPPKYTLTFNPNGGTTPTTNKTVTYSSTYGELPTPTRKGYKFLGWFTSKTGGTQITSDSLVTITSDQTLYAQWEQASVKATLTDLGTYKLCEVTGENINTDCTVFVVGYKENIPVNVQSRAYSDNLKAFAIIDDIDMVKVFLWDSVNGMMPTASSVAVPQNEWQ